MREVILTPGDNGAKSWEVLRRGPGRPFLFGLPGISSRNLQVFAPFLER
jgi:hypothetical protein